MYIFTRWFLIGQKKKSGWDYSLKYIYIYIYPQKLSIRRMCKHVTALYRKKQHFRWQQQMQLKEINHVSFYRPGMDLVVRKEIPLNRKNYPIVPALFSSTCRCTANSRRWVVLRVGEHGEYVCQSRPSSTNHEYKCRLLKYFHKQQHYL